MEWSLDCDGKPEYCHRTLSSLFASLVWKSPLFTLALYTVQFYQIDFSWFISIWLFIASKSSFDLKKICLELDINNANLCCPTSKTSICIFFTCCSLYFRDFGVHERLFCSFCAFLHFLFSSSEIIIGSTQMK